MQIYNVLNLYSFCWGYPCPREYGGISTFQCQSTFTDLYNTELIQAFAIEAIMQMVIISFFSWICHWHKLLPAVNKKTSRVVLNKKCRLQNWHFRYMELLQHCEEHVYICFVSLSYQPASVAWLDAPSDWRPGGRGFSPRRGRQHSFVEIDHEIFSTVILSLPLIQEGQLSVSGERMCTILVDCLED